MSDDEANDDEVTEGGEAIDPRQDLGRAVHQALDAIDCAIEKTRAAADHADDAYGDPNPVSGELEDLLGMLRIWYAAASMVLEDVHEDQ
jgi:hypothetical protein